MRRMLVIGMGAGDPEFLTTQAVTALNAVDVFFVLDKGQHAAALAKVRQMVCDRYIRAGAYRTVTVPDPARDRTAADYPAAVRDWRDERTARLQRAILDELPDGGCGGFLVWGDPSLYDGTIRILTAVAARGELAVDLEVIPGVSSVAVLAAHHRITLNRVAGAVQITTGRRLAGGLPDGVDDIVVMLDADLTCRRYAGEDIDIYWGAYLGTPDETLIAGRLGAVVDQIADTRERLRAEHGWIMDTYLLRRDPGADRA